MINGTKLVKILTTVFQTHKKYREIPLSTTLFKEIIVNLVLLHHSHILGRLLWKIKSNAISDIINWKHFPQGCRV